MPGLNLFPLNNKNKPPLNSRIGAFNFIVLVACMLLLFYAVTKESNPTTYIISNGNFKIATAFGQTIKISDITKIQIKNYLPGSLSRIAGYGNGSIVKGKCSSDIGNVTLYVDTSQHTFIYLTTKSGIVILNDQTTAKTESLYNTLNQHIQSIS